MSRRRSPVFSRTLVLALVALGIFVLADILLFSWMLFRSLSQREVNNVLFETRQEAQDLAKRLEEATGQPDGSGLEAALVIAGQPQIQQLIDSDQANREVIRVIELRGLDDSLLYRTTPKPGSPTTVRDDSAEGPTAVPLTTDTAEANGATQDGSLMIRENIGTIGVLQIGLSPARMHERTEKLRRELVQQTLRIMVVSLLVLVSAYLAIGLLLRRARRLEDQAREADRMAYVGTLAAGLAHEIRSPLNSLSLNLQMLEEDAGVSRAAPTNRRLFQITTQEIRRLERLVTDFLLFARPRRIDTVEVPAIELLERVRDVLSGEIRARGARVRVEDRSGGARLKVDLEQMSQMLLNLLNNALAATEESGRPPEITLQAVREGSRVLLIIEDNGVGIPPEEQERIFDAFYSTRKGGTGLGLAVVQRIVQGHGGMVQLESEPGRGTQVTVALPAPPG